jgi:hypothetical protein
MECSMAAHEASGAPVAAGSGGGAMARGRGFGASGQISEEGGGFRFNPGPVRSGRWLRGVGSDTVRLFFKQIINTRSTPYFYNHISNTESD